MSLKLESWKLALTIIGLTLTVLTLATSLAFSLGILNAKVDLNSDRLVRIEGLLDNGAVCRQCTISSK